MFGSDPGVMFLPDKANEMKEPEKKHLPQKDNSTNFIRAIDKSDGEAVKALIARGFEDEEI